MSIQDYHRIRLKEIRDLVAGDVPNVEGLQARLVELLELLLEIDSDVRAVDENRHG